VQVSVKVYAGSALGTPLSAAALPRLSRLLANSKAAGADASPWPNRLDR